MSHFRIPEHLGLCQIDGHILLLDLRRDRYFELDPGSAMAFSRWRERNAEDPGDPGLSLLVERGLLVRSNRPAPAGWNERATPRRSLLDMDGRRGRSWPLVPEVAACLWGARRRLGRGLEAAIARVRESREGTMASDGGAEPARFASARRLVPLAPNCLTDSLALASFLARRRIGFELVFGVKRDPFAAHCWLEMDGAVANDSADSVATFTPILVA
jgi:hypothetical protein